MSDVKRMRRTAALLVGLVLLLPTWSAEAHDIPADVTVQAYVKPEGNRIHMIVRVPLSAMRDYNFPMRDPGYLRIQQATPMARDAAVQWIRNFVTMYEAGDSLGFPDVRAVRISVPGDKAFQSYQTALDTVQAPPPPDGVDLPLEQAMLDILMEWPISSPSSDFSVDARWAHLGMHTVTVLRFIPYGGHERDFQYSGNPGLVRLDPRWFQASFSFVKLGFFHILSGIDHMLFLLCLIIPIRSFWALLPIITSFTIAHSITLIASALGLAPNALWFPPLIEMLIALSIVFMAFENIIGAKLDKRWMMSFGFGLVHGFGFSFALRESLQFAGSHLLVSLFSFNVGVELGQLFVLVITVPALQLMFRRWLPDTMGTILLSAIVAHTGWHWMATRFDRLLQYNFQLPVLDAAFAATVLRWLMLVLIIVGMLWILKGAYGALSRKFPSAIPKRGPTVTADATDAVAVEGLSG
jgi:HupE / UreJ protein